MPSTAKVKLTLTCKTSPGKYCLLTPPSQFICISTADKSSHQQHLTWIKIQPITLDTCLPFPIHAELHSNYTQIITALICFASKILFVFLKFLSSLALQYVLSNNFFQFLPTYIFFVQKMFTWKGVYKIDIQTQTFADNTSFKLDFGDKVGS